MNEGGEASNEARTGARRGGEGPEGTRPAGGIAATGAGPTRGKEDTSPQHVPGNLLIFKNPLFPIPIFAARKFGLFYFRG